jgi:hypothetical protein
MNERPSAPVIRALRPHARAADLGLMTNLHSINEYSASARTKPEHAEVLFQAINAAQSYLIDRVVWTGRQQSDNWTAPPCSSTERGFR